MSASPLLSSLTDSTRALSSHADGSNETILDLAKLDPITLASLFKRFLAQLPHPVFTHHLFGLFIATSRTSFFTLHQLEWQLM